MLAYYKHHIYCTVSYHKHFSEVNVQDKSCMAYVITNTAGYDSAKCTLSQWISWLKNK